MNQRKNRKIFTWRINLFIFLVFSFGCIFGIGISDLPTTIDAYLSRSIETNAYGGILATDCNATSGNLIPDATSLNASNSNTQIDEIYLTGIQLQNSSVKPGERVYFNLSTQGNCLSGVVLSFVNENETYILKGIQENDSNGNTYFDVPEEIIPGNYKLKDILLIATSNYGNTFSKTYSIDSTITAYKLDYSANITVLKDETKKNIKLNNLSFETKEVNIGDNIYLNFSTDSEITTAKFIFRNNETSDTVAAYMKEENNKKYISFATSTPEGKYTLESVILTSPYVTTIYSQNGSDGSIQYNFDTILQLKKVDQTKLEYNNENITEQDILEIKNSTNIKTVIINADLNSTINAEIFGAIQGCDITLIINYRNNQFIFYGKEINEIKDIDVSIRIETLSDKAKSSDIKSLVSNGVVVSFASNGNLPSTAIVKLKQTSEMKNVLQGMNIYVYYYDEDTKLFEEVALDISLKENSYYEIPIKHNSRFLLTTEKLDKSLIQETEDENVVSFLMSNKVYLILIVLAFVLIVVIVVIIIVYKVKNKKKNIELNKNVKKEISIKEDQNKVEEKNNTME